MSKLFVMILLLSISKCNFAQNLLHDDSLLIGTWNGTSICQIRPSACNDEIAAYHIKKGNKPNVYHMIMNKVINGKEEDMGEGDYVFDHLNKTLIFTSERYKIIVTFNVKGDKMDGTMKDLNDEKKLYRIIKLTKTSPD